MQLRQINNLIADWSQEVGKIPPELITFLEEEKRAGVTYYPEESQILRAFQETPFTSVKVVIVGQDPYHGSNQANGLCFSVERGVPLPPSLKNIFKELHSDLGITPSSHGDLSSWARQGVLLLNTTLTVRANEPGSHQGYGWELFTDQVISALNRSKEPLVFILWGKFAQTKCKEINENHHRLLKAAHPSPFSAYSGFFTSRPFSQTNAQLRAWGKEAIDWSL